MEADSAHVPPLAAPGFMAPFLDPGDLVPPDTSATGEGVELHLLGREERPSVATVGREKDAVSQ
ncbi:hypothetical protein SHKM778_81790 [Streptomyces sp. KM77-8]|uniref:Uncharacterized protein n=1 Tax=Streptomyces haneummycinicus TaxID=3074435 RepID=A0AAT9HXH1_9ACTN